MMKALFTYWAWRLLWLALDAVQDGGRWLLNRLVDVQQQLRAATDWAEIGVLIALVQLKVQNKRAGMAALRRGLRAEQQRPWPPRRPAQAGQTTDTPAQENAPCRKHS